MIFCGCEYEYTLDLTTCEQWVWDEYVWHICFEHHPEMNWTKDKYIDEGDEFVWNILSVEEQHELQQNPNHLI